MKLMNKMLTLCSLGMLVSVLGCGHPTILQSIALSPANPSIESSSLPGLEVTYQFTAVGTYVTQREAKETQTINISDSPGLTWSVDPPSFATVVVDNVHNVANVTPTGKGCGTITITATAQGAVGPGTALQTVIGTTTLDLIDTGTDCTGTQTPALIVAVTDTGGSVSGFTLPNDAATSILGCTNVGGSNCIATNLTNGTTVALQATAPATFSINSIPICVDTETCDIVLNDIETVTVTF